MQDHDINKSIVQEVTRLEKKRKFLQNEVIDFIKQSNDLRSEVSSKREEMEMLWDKFITLQWEQNARLNADNKKFLQNLTKREEICKEREQNINRDRQAADDKLERAKELEQKISKESRENSSKDAELEQRKTNLDLLASEIASKNKHIEIDIAEAKNDREEAKRTLDDANKYSAKEARKVQLERQKIAQEKEAIQMQKWLLEKRDTKINEEWDKVNDEWKQIKSAKQHLEKLKKQYGWWNSKTWRKSGKGKSSNR